MKMFVINRKLFTFIIFCSSINKDYCADNVESFAKYVLENIQHSESMHLPVDNSAFKPPLNNKIIDFGRYDFIIIGAGSTGTVIANRLSEVNHWKILLLEVGNFTNKFATIPGMTTAVWYSQFNWGYYSVPQNKSCLAMNDRMCPYPRGKGVGGSSLINTMMYSRGNPKDFDTIEQLGNPGWSYKKVLPYFLKSENLNKNNADAVIDWTYHDKLGELNVEFNTYDHPQVKAFYDANKELGYNFTDVNSPKQIGFSPIPFTIKNGKRFDTGTAFISPILERKNLKVLTNSLVTKIIIEKNKTATGVQFSHNGSLFVVHANKEVIMSAGAINTPQLLMLSGVGPSKHLLEKNITVIKNLEVGTILREHPAYYGFFFTTNYTAPVQEFKEIIKDYLNGTGTFTIPLTLQAFGFYQTQMETRKNYPDLELLLTVSNCTGSFVKRAFNLNNEIFNAKFTALKPDSCIQIVPIVLHVKSRGYISLQSNSPYDFPLINPNHLGDKAGKDFKTMYEGIKLILKLTETESFKNINAKIAGNPLPGCSEHKYLSRDYWKCTIPYLTYNLFHPVGSCPMGPNPKKGAVVDHNLEVYGIKRLRVADASVFPLTLSGHPNAPCIMIGEKVSDIIKGKY